MVENDRVEKITEQKGFYANPNVNRIVMQRGLNDRPGGPL